MIILIDDECRNHLEAHLVTNLNGSFLNITFKRTAKVRKELFPC